MAGCVGDLKQASDFLVLDDDFWHSAFDKDAPFYDQYLKSYPKGLSEEWVPVLDMHREAIFYLTEGAIIPVISRLLRISCSKPDSDFVESLSFYLGLEENYDKFSDAVKRSSVFVLEGLLVDTAVLTAKLQEYEEDDQVNQLSKFSTMLKTQT